MDLEAVENVSGLELASLDAEERARVQDILSGKKKRKKGHRQSMQDFSTFPLYMTETLWAKIMDKEEDNLAVLQKIVEFFAEEYGLRCPSEGTKGALASLLACRDEKDKQSMAVHGYTFFVHRESKNQHSDGKIQVPQSLS